jgi:hypothetical protein
MIFSTYVLIFGKQYFDIIFVKYFLKIYVILFYDLIFQKIQYQCR